MILMSKWEYGELYKKYDMDGLIQVPFGILKVHDIFEPLPCFMKTADVVFCDPPCSLGNINTFYTKADRTDYQDSYEPFVRRFFECIDEIKPKILYVEVFKSNKDRFIEECAKRYKYGRLYKSCYYHNKKNECWIIQANNEKIKEPDDFLDEEDFIKWVCANIDYNVIGDLCMGQGLVGWYSCLNQKRFVGTEINKKRLAVLVDKVVRKYAE